MASMEWMEIYRAYSGDELNAEIERLKKEATLFNSQTRGSKSFMKDLQMVQNRLHAAIRVRNERANANSSDSVGYAAFN